MQRMQTLHCYTCYSSTYKQRFKNNNI
ncbi:hypothetical protein MTR67_030087 [Solanum verrucosum]|uniref:Uncharacterized protein n=1 Tax=Solanum verrucosum TaxID=315347 RepID=A0AAF0R5F4_SOLVR|nr:hypothetical protein MTR67_030087 [Solanum verrucosum]